MSSESESIIAIIDDDKGVREATRTLLRSLGYSTTTFASADEFLRSGTAAHTSCIISDIRMPGMGGVGLQESLLQQTQRIPIIFMTAFPEDKVRQRVMAAGALGFLVKPYQASSLIGCIETALAA